MVIEFEGPRFVEWGHWRVTFWTGDRNHLRSARAIASISFPVGACGPCDGFLGSPERQRWIDACRAWTERGELPEGAACPIDQSWLFDPTYPDAKWKPGTGWTGPVRRGREWVFDFTPGEFGS